MSLIRSIRAQSQLQSLKGTIHLCSAQLILRWEAGCLIFRHQEPNPKSTTCYNNITTFTFKPHWHPLHSLICTRRYPLFHAHSHPTLHPQPTGVQMGRRLESRRPRMAGGDHVKMCSISTCVYRPGPTDDNRSIQDANRYRARAFQFEEVGDP